MKIPIYTRVVLNIPGETSAGFSLDNIYAAAAIIVLNGCVAISTGLTKAVVNITTVIKVTAIAVFGATGLLILFIDKPMENSGTFSKPFANASKNAADYAEALLMIFFAFEGN